jgi:hypothetical protein
MTKEFNWGSWVEGLVLAIGSGTIDYVILTGVAPDADWKTLLAAAGVMGLKAGLAYVKNNRPSAIREETVEAVKEAVQEAKLTGVLPNALVERPRRKGYYD